MIPKALLTLNGCCLMLATATAEVEVSNRVDNRHYGDPPSEPNATGGQFGGLTGISSAAQRNIDPAPGNVKDALPSSNSLVLRQSYFGGSFSGSMPNYFIGDLISPTTVEIRAVAHSATAPEPGSFEISTDPDFSPTEPPAFSVLAGSGDPGDSDGFQSAAEFFYPAGIARYSDGSLFISDTGNQKIRKRNAEGLVTTIAGSGTFGSTNGAGAVASFAFPGSLAIRSDGTITVADSFNHCLRELELNQDGWQVGTFAGAGYAGFHDSTAGSALFDTPFGVAVDPGGNHWVADTENHRVRRIDPNRSVATIAGSAVAGSADGTGTAAQFNQPAGTAADAAGNAYIADFGNHQIRKVTPAGAVTTIAGDGNIGSADGVGSVARFSSPSAIALLGATLYVCDEGNHTIRAIAPPETEGGAWQVSTLDLAGLGLNTPAAITCAEPNSLFVADTGNHRIVQITLPGALPATLDPSRPGYGEVFAIAENLQPSTTYYFRWVSPGGLPSSEVTQFTTPDIRPFRSWQLQNFGASADVPQIAGPLADPYGTGITNLEAYAQNISLGDGSGTGLPSISREGGLLSLTYQRFFSATDVSMQAEWSIDAVSWSSAGVAETPLQEVGDVEIVRASIPDQGRSRIFMRLTLTLNE